MEEFDKVVVMTPYTILEKTENEKSGFSHEDILYRMLSENTWAQQKEIQAEKLYDESISFHGVSVNLNAAYLAFYIGFSVVYETEKSILVFVSDFVTENHIDYVRSKYQNDEGRYISFIAYKRNENNKLVYLEDDASKYEGVRSHYSIVYNHLIDLMKEKKDLLLEEETHGKSR